MFAAAYPGRDSLGETEATYRELLRQIPAVRAILDGRYHSEEHGQYWRNADAAAADSRRFIAESWFPSLFPPPPLDEDDDG